MAIIEIGNDDVELMTNSAMHTLDVSLNYFPLQLVGSATIATTPTKYPIGELTISSPSVNWTSQKVGQYFTIHSPDGTFITAGVVRKAPSGSHFYMDGKSRGDASLAWNIRSALASGQIVRVYTYRPLWALLSRIYNGIFYKQYDIPYTNQGSRPNPVVNIGGWRQSRVANAGQRKNLTFTTNGSFSWRGTLGVPTWTLPSAAIQIEGTIADDEIVISLPEGFHIIQCSMSTSLGATQVSYRPIWINGPNFPSLDEQFAVAIPSDGQDQQSRKMNFELKGMGINNDTIPFGTAMMFSEKAYFDGQLATEGTNIEDYVGFITRQTDALQWGATEHKQISIETLGSAGMLELIPMVSQAIIEKSNPANWTEVINGLGTPDFIAWYVLKHHSTYMDLFDFYPLEDENKPRKKNWGLNGSNVWEYVNQSGTIIRGNIGTNSGGHLKFKRDPNIEETDFRDDLPVVFEWDLDNLTKEVSIVNSFNAPVGQIRCYCLLNNGNKTSAFASIAPGFTQSHAPGRQEEESLLVYGANAIAGQDKINRISGHIFAALNPKVGELQISPKRNIDVAEPVDMLWHRLNLPKSPFDDPSDEDAEAFNTRFLIKNIDRTWTQTDNGGWVKEIGYTISPETYGQPGETLIIDKGGGSIYPPEEPPVVGTPDFQENLRAMFAWNDQDGFARNTSGNSWVNIRSDIIGTVNDMALDYSSSYITSGYTLGSLKAYIVTVEGNTFVRVYRTNDALASNVTWDLMLSGDVLFNVNSCIRICTSKTSTAYVAVGYAHTEGCYLFWSTDSANNWTTPFPIGESGSSDANCAALFQFGMAVEDTYTIISGRSTVSADGQGNHKYRLFYNSTLGGTSSDYDELTDETDVFGIIPFTAIEVNEQGSVYASTNIQLNPLVSDTGFWQPSDLSLLNSPSYQPPNFFDSVAYEDSLTDNVVSSSGNYDLGINRRIDDFTNNEVTTANRTCEDGASEDDMTVNVNVTIDGVWESLSAYVVYNVYDYTGFFSDFPFIVDEDGYYCVVSYNGGPSVWFEMVDSIGTVYDGEQLELSAEFVSPGLTPNCDETVITDRQSFTSHTSIDTPVRELRVWVSLDGNNKESQYESDDTYTDGKEFAQTSILQVGWFGQKKTARNHPTWRIDNYASASNSAVDITPGELGFVVGHYGICPDLSTPNVVRSVMGNAGDLDLVDPISVMKSTSFGNAWSTLATETLYFGIRQRGKAGVYFGVNKLDMTFDEGATLNSYLQDWSTSIGTVGEIRGVVIL